MFCEKCGSEISEDEKICGNCGAVIGNTSEENAANEENFEVMENEKVFGEEISEASESKNIFEGESFGVNESYSDADTKSRKTKNTVKFVLMGALFVIILGGVFAVFMNVYGNSPERIFEKVKESDSYKKYIEEKGYNVKGYYFVDLINDDGKKEIVIDVAQEMGKRATYIGLEENGKYRIGMFGSIGGELIDTIEVFKNTGEPKGLFICLKNFTEIPQEYIDSVKTQMQIESDEDAKAFAESMYGVGLEQYAHFNMTDYTFVNYDERNAELNSIDFVIGFTPEKILAKSVNSESGEATYQYLDMYEDKSQDDGTPDYSVSEEEFNNYIDELKSGKELVEYFSVSAD